MNKQEKIAFERANKAVHPVEKQWHFEILIAAGFAAKTGEATGFVRRYDYEHPDGRVVTCHTGVSCDYWISGGVRGYWPDLEHWCKTGKLLR